jgi:hypothetical protein
VHVIVRLLPLDTSGPVYHIEAPDGTLDVYEITFAPQADADDIEGIEAFLLRHGRTGHGHEVEIRVLGQDGALGTFHS